MTGDGGIDEGGLAEAHLSVGDIVALAVLLAILAGCLALVVLVMADGIEGLVAYIQR